MKKTRFTRGERVSVFSLSSILVFRLFGLFLVLPVLALHAEDLSGSTPVLIGIAIGIYGLTQALLQVPFGMASDRWGRKPLITIGLIIFAFGSWICADADSLQVLILGRALQGGGAISAVILAFAGDLVRKSQRPKSMAIFGASIGSAFTLSLMFGPVLDGWIGVRGMFFLAVLLSILGILITWTIVPNPELAERKERVTMGTELVNSLLRRKLIGLLSGTLILHAAMASLFLVFPIILVENLEFLRADTWKVYVPSLLLSFITMVPVIRFSSREGYPEKILVLAAIVIAIAELSMGTGSILHSAHLAIFGFWLFFVGFNVLEALLPAITLNTAPAKKRGTVMGFFNSSTFIGAFIGGVVSGILYSRFGVSGVFAFSGIVILLWGGLFRYLNRRLSDEV